VNTWTDIKAAFDDITRDSNRVFFPAATVVRWANRGLEGLCDEARYVDSANVANSSTASPNQYGVAAGGYDVFRVEYDGEALLPITRDHFVYGIHAPKVYAIHDGLRCDCGGTDEVDRFVWDEH
jgi:hypothetical protein